MVHVPLDSLATWSLVTWRQPLWSPATWSVVIWHTVNTLVNLSNINKLLYRCTNLCCCNQPLSRRPLPLKGCKFWPMLGTHGHWAVPHKLWHGAYIYNGHFRGPVTLTPIAKRLAVELSLPLLTTKVCRGWDSKIQPSACGANAITHCATACKVLAIYISVVLSVTFYKGQVVLNIHV